MGTAAYMAPEQAKGKPADKRADVWAFGCVVYEMLCGRRMFVGDDVSEVMVGVIKSEPAWDALPLDLSPSLVTYLKRCLDKDPRERIRDIGDVRLAMAGAFEMPTVGPSASATAELVLSTRAVAPWQRPIGVGLVAMVAALVSTLAFWGLTRPTPVTEGLARFTITPPDTVSVNFGGAYRDLTISPDGTKVIYGGFVGGSSSVLSVRPVDQLVSAPLRGTENGFNPFASPDGEWVGFVALSGTVLLKASILGGPPVMLAGVIRGASWGSDGQIVFGTIAGGLFRVSGGGGEPEPLTTPDEGVVYRWPAIILGRQAVLFVTTASSAQPLTTGQLAVLDLATREVTPLGLAGVSPRYVETGHVAYAAADGSLRAVPFDMGTVGTVAYMSPEQARGQEVDHRTDVWSFG